MSNRVRRRNQIQPPDGWEKVRDMVLDLNQKMRDVESTDNTEGSTKSQIWEVMRANWKRSRPIYEMRWKTNEISNDLYEWILKNEYADRELINAWRKPGYDRLCCVACIYKNSDHGGVCMCRVPKNQRRNKDIQCFNCGCNGCCSGDFSSESESEGSEYYSESDDESKDKTPAQ